MISLLSELEKCFSDNKPAFGPDYVYFYEGHNKNLFVGKILISLRTQNGSKHLTKSFEANFSPPSPELVTCTMESFMINMVLVNADAVNTRENQLQFHLSCEGIPSNTIEVDLNEYEKQMGLKFVNFTSNFRPCLSTSIKLPDHRSRFEMISLIQQLTEKMVRTSRLKKSLKSSRFFLENKFEKLRTARSSLLRQRKISRNLHQKLLGRLKRIIWRQPEKA